MVTRLVGVSLKAYFGQTETLSWSRQVARLAGTSRPISEGLVELVVFPSNLFLTAVGEIFSGTPVRVGSQDVSCFPAGAYTGETPAVQLREIGVSYVEVGHAERRRYFRENDSTVAKKVSISIENGLRPLLCVGEEQPLGPKFAARVCIDQIRKGLDFVSTDPRHLNAVIAYEPVWAIGQSKAASAHHIRQSYQLIRDFIDSSFPGHSMRIIYGGSAGPGLYTELGGGLSGLFLGRFAHDVKRLASIVDEVAAH